MATKQVTWTSRTRLSCAGCLPADIVLCVPEDLVATVPHTTINATLTVVTPISDSCAQTTWKYVATYDDTQLIVGANLLGSQITGAFCKGCLTQWVLDQVTGSTGPYIAPTRTSGGNYDSGAGVTPADGLTGGVINFSYTNTLSQDVSFLPLIESPLTLFDMADGNAWSVDLVVTPSYAAANTPAVARLTNASGSDMTDLWGPGMFTYPGPTTIAPGDTITIAMHWVFNRITFTDDAFNHVEIFGPHITYIAHAI